LPPIVWQIAIPRESLRGEIDAAISDGSRGVPEQTYARSGRKTLEIVVQKGGSIEDCVPMCSCLVSNGGASAGCPPPGIIILMRTQGEIESAICEGISRFEQD